MSTITVGRAVVSLDFDLVATASGLENCIDVIVGLLRLGTDPNRPVPGLTWSVGDLNAHIAGTAHNYRGMAEGATIINEAVAERRVVIDRGIEEHRSEDVGALAEAVGLDLRGIVAALRDADADTLVPFYGTPTPLAIVGGLALGEMLTHGWDLARAHGTLAAYELPDDASYQALLASYSLVDLVLTTAGTKASTSYGNRLPGRKPLIVVLEPGAVRVTHEQIGRIDAWFSGTPGTTLLASHGRLSAWQLMRTIRGGRRPWRALTMDRLFESS